MKNPAHSNEMLRIVLDLAMVHQSVLELTFRRPVPERPDAVRFSSRSCLLRTRDGTVTNERVITAVDRVAPHNRRATRTTVLGACKMLLMRMVDSPDVSRLTLVLPILLFRGILTETAVTGSAHSPVLCT